MYLIQIKDTKSNQWDLVEQQAVSAQDAVDLVRERIGITWTVQKVFIICKNWE